MAGIYNTARIVGPLLLAGAIGGCALPGYKTKMPGDHWYNFGTNEEDEATYSDDLDRKQVTDYKPRLVKITPALIAHQKNENGQKELDPEVEKLTQNPEDVHYKIGPGDVLSIVLYEHEELMPQSKAKGGDKSVSGDARGQRVDSHGNVFFPYAGETHVEGLTLAQARRKLTQKVSSAIKDPQLDVNISDFRSKRVYISGDISKPCTVPINDTSMTAVRALGQCSSVSGPETEEGTDIGIRNVVLVRDGKSTMVNLNDVASSGREIPLKADDRLLVDDTANRVFMVGEFEKQKALPFRTGGMSLNDAISDSSGVSLDTANTKAVYVIRNFVSGRDMEDGGVKTSMRPTVYKLDISTPSGMLLANQFELEPRDVVFAAPASMVNFNRTLSLILPSLDQIFRSVSLYERFR